MRKTLTFCRNANHLPENSCQVYLDYTFKKNYQSKL